MIVLGILGWPVAHSRSPAMHKAALEAAGLNGAYVPFAVPPEKLSAAVRGLDALGVRGFNVTLPHKEHVIACLDDIEADARAIGAVNTVVRENERLVGTNTDATGLVRALEEAGVTVASSRVTVLGAGGAARGAVVGLARAGASSITVCARRSARATALARELQGATKTASLDVCDFEKGLLHQLAETDLLVQATSATLQNSPVSLEFAESLPLFALPKSASVVDLVYEPRDTTVLKAARALGLGTVDGLGMLLYQGAAAFERWTGCPAPIAAMRQALEHA